MQALDDDGDDALGDGGDDGFDVDALEIPDPLEEEEDGDDDKDGPIGLGDLVDAGLLEPGRDKIVLEYEGTLAVVVFRADLLPDGALIFENKICQSPPSVELARFLARCCFLPLSHFV